MPTLGLGCVAKYHVPNTECESQVMRIYTECENQAMDMEKNFGRNLILHANSKNENTNPKKLKTRLLLT